MEQKTKMVRLGDYIEQCDERNDKGLYTADNVVGISTSKVFIPTKANMEGVSTLSYKLVNPTWFCYVADTSRRGDKMALAYNNTDKTLLVSSIYTTFKVKDTEVLSPEFLYLFFNRPAFDRYTRFNSWGSARETFDWGEMSRVEIPLPPISVQREIAALYHCAAEAKRMAEEAETVIGELYPALIQLAKHS